MSKKDPKVSKDLVDPKKIDHLELRINDQSLTFLLDAKGLIAFRNP